MVIVIMTGRQGGKSTFAINELFLKEKDFHLFFCKGDLLKQQIKNIPSPNKNIIERIHIQSEHFLRGRCGKGLIEKVICDDYEWFNEKFRRDLMTYYCLGLIKQIYIFASNNSNGINDGIDFKEIVNTTRSLNLNDNLRSDERTNKIKSLCKTGLSFLEDDVVNLRNTVIINDISGFDDFSRIDDYVREEIIRMRFKQYTYE